MKISSILPIVVAGLVVGLFAAPPGTVEFSLNYQHLRWWIGLADSERFLHVSMWLEHGNDGNHGFCC